MTYTLEHIYIRGKVTAGLHERGEYLGDEHFRRGFLEELGIDPSYGTLNLRLNDRNLMKFRRLKMREGTVISGAKEGDQTKGDIKAFEGEVHGLKCAVVIVKGMNHDRILELVSNYHLRRELGLNNGDRVWVKVKL